ncbi:MAG: hypothetical protein HKL86_01180 [Acidimicrobiaceae bacterium]|nr:hypothetical protein [Acidimicrobiaceae bacterium]
MIAENPSGCFWDSGVGAVSYSGSDHWSSQSAMERLAWADLGPQLSNFLSYALDEPLNGGEQ